MSVLATFAGGWGHVEPMIAVARHASELGHEVAFAGQTALLGKLAALGFATIEVGPSTLSSSRRPLAPVDAVHERAVIRDFFVGQVGAQRATALYDLMCMQRPDVVLCEEIDVGAVVAAERLSIPTIVVNVLAAGRTNAPGVIASAWNGLRQANHLDPDPDTIRLGGTIEIASFPASFRAPELSPRPQWQPVRPPTARDPRLMRDRFVYATLGTIFNTESGDLFHRLLDGLGESGIEALLTVGDSIDPSEFRHVPHNVTVERYVPQAEIIGSCSAVLCHGGSGTLMAALSNGLPVIALPLGADQPDNGDRVNELGCGIVLDPLTATPTTIAAAIACIHDNSEYRHQAASLRAEAAAQPELNQLPHLAALLEAP